MKQGKIRVQEIAKALDISERRLYRLVKELTGDSPARLVQDIRLGKAYELLTTASYVKVYNVCREVGYSHVSNFSLLFLAKYGKRPAELLLQG